MFRIFMKSKIFFILLICAVTLQGYSQNYNGCLELSLPNWEDYKIKVKARQHFSARTYTNVNRIDVGENNKIIISIKSKGKVPMVILFDNVYEVYCVIENIQYDWGYYYVDVVSAKTNYQGGIARGVIDFENNFEKKKFICFLYLQFVCRWKQKI